MSFDVLFEVTLKPFLTMITLIKFLLGVRYILYVVWSLWREVLLILGRDFSFFPFFFFAYVIAVEHRRFFTFQPWTPGQLQTVRISEYVQKAIRHLGVHLLLLINIQSTFDMLTFIKICETCVKVINIRGSPQKIIKNVRVCWSGAESAVASKYK